MSFFQPVPGCRELPEQVASILYCGPTSCKLARERLQRTPSTAACRKIQQYDRTIKRLTETEYPETQALLQVYGRRPAHSVDLCSDAGQQGTVPAKPGCRLLSRPAAETQPVRGPRPTTRHHQGWQYLPQVTAGRARQPCPRAAWKRLDVTTVGSASGIAWR